MDTCDFPGWTASQRAQQEMMEAGCPGAKIWTLYLFCSRAMHIVPKIYGVLHVDIGNFGDYRIFKIFIPNLIVIILMINNIKYKLLKLKLLYAAHN